MCELMGINFNEVVNPDISFKGFRNRSQNNPHGWGIAYYPDNAAQIIKEPKMAIKSKLLTSYASLKSHIFIAHVRYSSSGGIAFKNTHPFSLKSQGKEYILAHNGTLSGYKRLKLGRFQPIGETDSEYIFCHLLNEIEENAISFKSHADFEWLQTYLQDLNEYGKLNLLFSDGTHLFAYKDKNNKGSLSFLRREPPFSKIQLLDVDFDIDLKIEKSPSHKGYIIATSPLTDEKWEKINDGQLMVFREGEQIF